MKPLFFFSNELSEIIFNEKPDITTKKLNIFGKIDCLHLPGNEIWNPGITEIDQYLDTIKENEIGNILMDLEGHYLACLQENEKIYIFCDRLVLQPYYYEVIPKGVNFYEHILDKDQTFRLNIPSAKNFLIFRYVPSGQTLFEGFRQFMPGEFLCINQRTGKIDRTFSNTFPPIILDKMDLPEARRQFHSLFSQAVEKRLSACPDTEPILLPLSGGFDSRLILAFLLEMIPASRIIAYTYGEPGTYDYEIAKRIVKIFGISHLQYPLNLDYFTIPELTQNCLDADGQINFVLEAPIRVYDEVLQHGTLTLSGNLGNRVMGDRIHPEKNATLTDKHDIFYLENTCKDPHVINMVKNTDLIEDSFYFPIHEPSHLTLAERWNYINPITKYVNYCVYKRRVQTQYISPFADFHLFNFMNALPREWRDDAYFYRDFFIHWYPKYAAIPNSDFRGAPLNAGPFQRQIAYHWDHVRMVLTGRYFRANKIDFKRYRNHFLDLNELHKFATKWLEPEMVEKIISKEQKLPVLYSMRALQVLCENFNITYNHQ
jgi:hypothetical protein